jgi:hypothetical protein
VTRRSPAPLVPHFARGLLAGALTLLTSCAGTRSMAHPTLIIETRGGTELGVSTDYGIVFLGRTAPAGDAQITAFFGDGPSVESSLIEPVDGGLYTAEVEIRLPSVPLSHVEPRAGDELLLMGHDDRGPWKRTVRVRTDPRVYGILLDVPARLEGAADQVGAGLYESDDGDLSTLRLVGLVTGRLQLETEDGPREYLTAMGPQHLWRLVTHRRDLDKRRRWIYREDIL